MVEKINNKLLNLGYCCINTTLAKSNIRSNRDCKSSTINKKGIEHAGKLFYLNLQDLYKIIQWNEKHNIRLYRMSSCIAPWMSKYNFNELSNYNEIVDICEKIGNFVKINGHRLTFHPGHFDVLASKSKKVVENTIIDLNRHSEIMSMMNLSETPYNAINIHINGVYGNKSETFKRFSENFSLLELHTQNRITLENDDKTGQWSVNDLYQYTRLYKSTQNIPIVFDYLHHQCHNDLFDENEALLLARKTWIDVNCKQLCHYSSSKINENSISMKRAHADYVYEKINTHGLSLDIELEAKAKELALLHYLNTY